MNDGQICSKTSVGCHPHACVAVRLKDSPFRSSTPTRAWTWHPARLRTVLLVGCVILALSGCAGSNFLPWNKEEFAEADAGNPVVEILCIWQPAEGRGVDNLPTRGFAGQILFFTRQNPAPVVVDGEVRIYLFDDKGTAAEQAKPIHQFDFKPDAWSVHLQASMLGPSYHVFIPYVRKDLHQARCALRLRLTPVDGPVIYSQMVSVTLPGPPKKEETENEAEAKQSTFDDRSNQPRIRQTSATVDVGRDDPREARIRRLEAMLEQLLDSQTAARRGDDLDDKATNRPTHRRFKLTPVENNDSDEPGAGQLREDRRHRGSGRRHPLLDGSLDGGQASPRRRPSASHWHPLADSASEIEAPDMPERSSGGRKHPLSEDLPARNRSRAAQSSPGRTFESHTIALPR